MNTYLNPLETSGVISTANFLDVLWFLNDCPRTRAPWQYTSLVARVTKAWSVTVSKYSEESLYSFRSPLLAGSFLLQLTHRLQLITSCSSCDKLFSLPNSPRRHNWIESPVNMSAEYMSLNFIMFCLPHLHNTSYEVFGLTLNLKITWVLLPKHNDSQKSQTVNI